MICVYMYLSLGGSCEVYGGFLGVVGIGGGIGFQQILRSPFKWLLEWGDEKRIIKCDQVWGLG